MLARAKTLKTMILDCKDTGVLGHPENVSVQPSVEAMHTFMEALYYGGSKYMPTG